MTPEEYEAAFHGIDLPQSLELYSGVNVHDVRKFIDSEIYILKHNNSKRVLESVKSRLDRALVLINSK